MRLEKINLQLLIYLWIELLLLQLALLGIFLLMVEDVQRSEKACEFLRCFGNFFDKREKSHFSPNFLSFFFEIHEFELRIIYRNFGSNRSLFFEPRLAFWTGYLTKEKTEMEINKIFLGSYVKNFLIDIKSTVL